MANEDPKWESKREKYTTRTATIIFIGGVAAIILAYALKDADYAKNLALLIEGFIGATAGYMFGFNNTKPSEAMARAEKTALAEGGSTMQSKIAELEDAVEGYKRNEQLYRELISNAHNRT